MRSAMKKFNQPIRTILDRAQRKFTRAVRLTEAGQKRLAQQFAIRLNRTGTAIAQ